MTRLFQIHGSEPDPDRDVRRIGYSWVLWRWGIAVGPFAARWPVGMMLPDFSPPGSEFLPILGAAIPGSMAVARRGAYS